jgi:hypothetical protein
MAGYRQTPSRLNAIADGWIYSIDEVGIHRSTIGYPLSQTHDRNLDDPIKDYLKRKNLTVDNIQKVKLSDNGKMVLYIWESETLQHSIKSQSWLDGIE